MHSLLILVFLPALCQATAVTLLDKNCTQPDTVNGGDMYAPGATNCDNVDDDAVCAALYTPAVNPSATAERATNCFGTSATGPVIQSFKDAAIASCPKTCGYCCQTPEFSCTNPTPSPLVCSNVVQQQCTDPKWIPEIAQYCPNVCGFCLEGGCMDAVSYCASQQSICFTSDATLLAFARANCARTCGTCSTATTASAVISATCVDSSTSCPSWVANQFCSSTFYTTAQKASYCAKSCGLCSGKK